MLRKALEELYTETTLSTGELAKRLGVGEGTVRLLLDELERQGYLASKPLRCSQECEGCPLRGTCVALGGERLWVLNREKARKALEGQ